MPHGEIEAAKAFGMSPGLMFRRIVLPSAFRRALPAYGNEVILMLQASALASAITILDITGVAGAIANRTFAFYEMYLMAAALYLALTYLIAWGSRKVEFRLKRTFARTPGCRSRRSNAGRAGNPLKSDRSLRLPSRHTGGGASRCRSLGRV